VRKHLTGEHVKEIAGLLCASIPAEPPLSIGAW
jgi:hypothetical protein